MLKGVIEIRESLYYRVVIEALLVTTISSENKPTKVADSSLYRGSISSRYIEGGLSRSLGRKGSCTKV